MASYATHIYIGVFTTYTLPYHSTVNVHQFTFEVENVVTAIHPPSVPCVLHPENTHK